MGNNNAKVGPLSIPMLIKQLNAYHLPEDRNGALETIEQIDIHLADPKTYEAKAKQFKDFNEDWDLKKSPPPKEIKLTK